MGFTMLESCRNSGYNIQCMHKEASNLPYSLLRNGVLVVGIDFALAELRLCPSGCGEQ